MRHHTPNATLPKTMDENTRLTRLEEKTAFLDQHVTEQDKVILRQSEEIDRLKREIAALAARLEELQSADAPPADQRPPHY